MMLMSVVAGLDARPVRSDTGTPSITCEPSRIMADDEFTWKLTLTLRNPLAVPVTIDSAWVVVDDVGPGETRIGRSSTLPLPGVRAVGTLAPGASRAIPWPGVATVEE